MSLPWECWWHLWVQKAQCRRESHLPVKSYHESLTVGWGLASLRVVSVCCLQQVYVDCTEFCTVCLCGTKFLFGEDQHFSEQMQKNELMDTYWPVLLSYCQVVFFFLLSQLYFCMTEGGCENMERASWGVNLTLPLVQCCMCMACDWLVLLLGFFNFISSCARYRYANNAKAETAAKAYHSSQLVVVKPDRWSMGSVSSSRCLYKKSLWLCLTRLWLSC